MSDVKKVAGYALFFLVLFSAINALVRHLGGDGLPWIAIPFAAVAMGVIVAVNFSI
ncbi:hypothetical protein [Brevundimonas sp.]|uniref:hypothetical protein n=1 Tax=Brevundimonas sp. TaxID=1871086 RepID=UPI0025C42C24|nr:hypothetical protein [Brevundimonas sp.]